MTRQTNLSANAAIDPAPVQLPVIDWASIGQTAPQPVAQPARQAVDPLPRADVVVITWTGPEWSALDHVFVNSGTTRDNGTGAWAQDWLAYMRGAEGFTGDATGGALWGVFRVVSMTAASGPLTVLLFHSHAHLKYRPYVAGLRAMVQAILADAQPKQLYSTGTAGGGALDQALGDVVVTNGAQFLPGIAPNDTDPANGQTFTCMTWAAPTTLFAGAQKLMFPMSKAATPADLQTVFDWLAKHYAVGSLTLADLINQPLQPANLATPTIHDLPGVPLNTSCNFGMAPPQGSTTYSAFEEDDAIIGQMALKGQVDFAFVRSVSDPVIAGGGAIPAKLRPSWGSALYDRYELVAACNNALATWAAIAAS